MVLRPHRRTKITELRPAPADDVRTPLGAFHDGVAGRTARPPARLRELEQRLVRPARLARLPRVRPALARTARHRAAFRARKRRCGCTRASEEHRAARVAAVHRVLRAVLDGLLPIAVDEGRAQVRLRSVVELECSEGAAPRREERRVSCRVLEQCAEAADVKGVSARGGDDGAVVYAVETDDAYALRV